MRSSMVELMCCDGRSGFLSEVERFFAAPEIEQVEDASHVLLRRLVAGVEFDGAAVGFLGAVEIPADFVQHSCEVVSVGRFVIKV